MALKMQEIIKDIKSPDGEPVRMRMGISTGPVTAGVIGVKKFIYEPVGRYREYCEPYGITR